MILFPAIDILDNKAVRLEKGKKDKATIYGTPEEFADKWIEQGAEFLHLVDLNGAFDNSDVNKKIIKNIMKKNIKVQVGGGINSLDRIKYYLEEIGANRVILGSACVNDQKLVEKAAYLFPNQIVGGVDALNNKVGIKGWVEYLDKSPLDIIKQIKEFGIDTFVYTDIARDGVLSGVNINNTIKIQNEANINIIASGGISTLDEIICLKENNVYGAILGRSLYAEKFTLQEALKV